MKNDRKMRVSDVEIAILNGLFADNEDLLIAIRNVFFDIASEQEKKFVEDAFAGKKEKLALMRKMFLPELAPEIPLGQTIDLWRTLDIKDKDDHEFAGQMFATQILSAGLEQSLKLLEDPNLQPVDLVINPKKLEKYTKPELLARNNFISHIEGVLMQMKVLAGMKNETPEQIKERLAKDSTK